MSKVKILTLIAALAGLVSHVCAASLVVDTTSGSFQGFNTGRDLEAWLGLPFAEAPVGNLRFKAPVLISKSSTTSVQNATAFGHACPQPDDGSLGATQAEDCLFLNVRRSSIYGSYLDRMLQVFRPAGTASNAKLPILFWLHVRPYIAHVHHL
jgi:hypothetical protein